MGDTIRLLIIAVLSFAVVGTAFVYSRDSEVFAGLPERLGAGSLSPLVFPADEGASGQSGTASVRLWIARPHHDQWMGLAGFPDTYTLRFPVPGGLTYRGATLELSLESQLAPNGDGRVTIQVNGERRGEIVLEPGQAMHRVEIGLAPEDLMVAAVTVALSASGTTNPGQICRAGTENSGVAVTISPESGLALHTDDPIDGVAARVAALADPMRLALGVSAEEQAVSIWASQILRRAGITVRLTPDDAAADLVMARSGRPPLEIDGRGRIALAGQAGIDALIARRAALLAARTPSESWPVTADQLGAETLVRTFRGTQRWTLDYALADLDRGLMPTHLDVALRTSVLSPGSEWIVRVSLNGNLLKTGRFDGQSETITMPVTLPITLQGLSNTVVVELVDASPDSVICSTGAEAQAQLLPQTKLSAVGRQPSDGWGEMVRTLARSERIGLEVDATLDASQARSARTLIGNFLPAHTEIVFDPKAGTSPVMISVTDGARLRSALRLADRMGAEAGGLHLVLAREGSDPLLLPFTSSEAAAVIERLEPDTVGVLIARQRERAE